MFPLGTVLFPSVFLPLHVFEPRYLSLVRRVLDGDGEFGVVLIERGSEVGGADTRTNVGTVARILEATELEDHRWVIGAVGVRRLRVREWLDDDPFPRADVADWDDRDPSPPSDEIYAGTVRRLRRVLALSSELGDPGPPSTVELTDDPVLGTYQLAAIAPFGPADQQRILAIEGCEDRLGLVASLLEDEADVLERRITMG